MRSMGTLRIRWVLWTVWWVRMCCLATGLRGGAAVFGTDGGSAFGTINVVGAFDPGNEDFSIAFWVKRGDGDSGDADGVFDALRSTGTGYQCNFRNVPDANQMAFRLDDDRGQFALLIDPEPTDDSEWHHFALVVNRVAGGALIYRDGGGGGGGCMTSCSYRARFRRMVTCGSVG